MKKKEIIINRLLKTHALFETPLPNGQPPLGKHIN